MVNRITLPAAALLLLSTTFNAVTAQDDPEAVKRAGSLVNEIVRLEEMGNANDWAPQLRELVELGPSATLPICEALRETDNDFRLRFFGFALRAIGDARAVPTLIGCIPRTLRPPRSDYGLQVNEPELLTFLQANDLTEQDRDGSFSFARPCREVMGALQKITDADLQDSELYHVFLNGGPLQNHLQRKLYHEQARRWEKWWDDHRNEMGLSLDFANVELEEFSDQRPEPINSFESSDAVVSYWYTHMTLTPVQSGDPMSFLDLDTGRTAQIGDAFHGDIKDIDEVIKWGKDNGYDLVGLQVPIEGYKEPQFVIKPIALEVWQSDGGRFDHIQQQIGDANFDYGIPCKDYVMHYDQETKQYDPDQTATFLFKTSQGSCGAIQLVCQVTNLIDPNGPRRAFGERPPNEGYRRGVKFNLKLIHEPSGK